MHPLWALAGVEFGHTTKIERQAEIWEHFAKIVLAVAGQSCVVRYEDLCEDTEATLATLARYLGVPDPLGVPELQNMNKVREYPCVPGARRAVKSICVSSKALGYQE